MKKIKFFIPLLFGNGKYEKEKIKLRYTAKRYKKKSKIFSFSFFQRNLSDIIILYVYCD